MTGEQLRFTIEATRKHWKLLSIAHRPTGLIVDTKPAANDRGDIHSISLTDRIESSRTTIHHSEKSGSGNLITHTTELGSGSRRRNAYFTTAIRSGTRYAPVLFRRFPIIDSEEAQHVPEGDHISLGSIDSTRFNLIVAVFVGRKDCEFRNLPDDNASANLHQVTIGQYRIVVMWTFLSMPSIQHGVMLKAATQDPASINDPEFAEQTRRWIQGFDEAGAIAEFREQSEFLRSNCIQLSAIQHPELQPRVFDLYQMGKFFRFGQPDASEKLRQHFESMAQHWTYLDTGQTEP